MGELILCSRPLAAFPYFLEDAGINIYSLEELCYYIEKNMYLLDERMMDEALCGWLETELAMPKTAGMLREIKSRKGSVAEFVSCLLRQADYFTPQKQREIVQRLQELAHTSEEERKKLRADRYAAEGRTLRAICEYHRLLRDKEEPSSAFTGSIWHNLGCAYAALFWFSRAADCFGRAYECSGNRESVKQCLFACFCAEDETLEKKAAEAFGMQTEELLAVKRDFLEIKRAQREQQETECGDMTSYKAVEEVLTEWKNAYRKNCSV